jgi:hypothetical protein
MNSDGPTTGNRDGAGDGEPESAASTPAVTCPSVVQPAEAGEDPLAVFDVYAGPIVAHRDLRHP